MEIFLAKLTLYFVVQMQSFTMLLTSNVWEVCNRCLAFKTRY